MGDTGDSGQDAKVDEVKNVSWATVLVISGLVFFVIGLVMRAPSVWVVALALLGAGAVTQLVTTKGRAR